MELLLALSDTATVIAIAVGLVVLLVIALFVFKYFNLWLQCITTNAEIGFIDLIGMSFRKINPRVIVQSKIAAVQSGLTLQTTRARGALPRGRPRHARRARADRSGPREPAA